MSRQKRYEPRPGEGPKERSDSGTLMRMLPEKVIQCTPYVGFFQKITRLAFSGPTSFAGGLRRGEKTWQPGMG